MKLIIAGCRYISDNYYDELEKHCIDFIRESLVSATNRKVTIISGKARGADTLGIKFANKYKLNLLEFPADWNSYGKRAGYLRNSQMRDEGTHLIAFWDGKSKGTYNMIQLAKKNLVVKVIRIDKHN